MFVNNKNPNGVIRVPVFEINKIYLLTFTFIFLRDRATTVAQAAKQIEAIAAVVILSSPPLRAVTIQLPVVVVVVVVAGPSAKVLIPPKISLNVVLTEDALEDDLGAEDKTEEDLETEAQDEDEDELDDGIEEDLEDELGELEIIMLLDETEETEEALAAIISIGKT